MTIIDLTCNVNKKKYESLQLTKTKQQHDNHFQIIAISGIVVGLWIIAIAFIQNPKNAAATAINNAGQEIIIYANMYFFSWLNFVAAIYLFGNVIRDNFAFNPKFSQWVLLFVASVVLTSTSVALHEDICNKADEVVCGRLKYATAVGALGIVFGLIAIIATMLGYMKRMLEIGCSFLVCVFYFFGVGKSFLL